MGGTGLEPVTRSHLEVVEDILVSFDPSRSSRPPLRSAGARWFDRVADGWKLTALQAQRVSGENVHRACDDEPENDQRDQRLHSHGQLGPMAQRHDVGRAERGGVR
jgi:hypothetical protein